MKWVKTIEPKPMWVNIEHLTAIKLEKVLGRDNEYEFFIIGVKRNKESLDPCEDEAEVTFANAGKDYAKAKEYLDHFVEDIQL